MATIERTPTPTNTRQGRMLVNAPQSAWARARERLGWILVSPTVLVIIVVALYPLFRVFQLSVTNARLGSSREPTFVGLDNYTRLLKDPGFGDALLHTVIFTAVSVTFEVILGLIIALVIHSQFRGRGAVRTSMLIPWAIPTVVSAQMWAWMYNDVFGVINDLLVNQLHILPAKVAWLANPATSLPAIIAVDIWKTTPFMALLLLAGLQVIPDDIYEASTVDGASKWKQFWSITLPLLRPALLVALIFRTMDAFRVFDVIFVMKQAASDTIVLGILARQRMIDLQRLGEGAAISVVIFLILAVFVVLYTQLIRVEES
jgi:trehalose/maltose transport system permease protein